MLHAIISFSVRNKLIVILMTAALIAVGIYNLTRLPIDAVPDITNNQVQVITVSPSLGAPEVERLITFPVEQTMATIPGITEMRSFSRFGLSMVTIVFTEDTDVYWARQQVNERLSTAASLIPAGAGKPELAPLTTGLGEIFQYVVRPKPGYESRFDAMELRTIQDWIIRRQLLGVDGVADVASWGGILKQYEIALNTEQLRSTGVSVEEVFSALEKNNQNTGGAYIEQRPNAYFIRSEGLIGSISDLEEIVVKRLPSGIPVQIRDVAKVQLGQANRYGAFTYNDKGEVTGAVVMMLKGANSSLVIEKVKERIEQIRKTLPEGVEIDAYLDRTKLVNNAISTVTKNLAEGALIVVFVLVLLLGNFRAGLIVASVIPLSMLFAVSMMNLFGVSGNLMSLGAIDFGLIVDGAVIIVEATMHHLGISKVVRKLSKDEMNQEVKDAAGKMMHSAVFGQLIILIVYLPILTLVGIEGKMFGPMAQTVAFAITGALLLSLTYVPMVSSLFMSRWTGHKANVSDKLINLLQKWYRPIVTYALQKRLLVISAAGVVLTISLVIFLRLGGEFIPTLDEGDFAVETRLLTGSSLSESVETTQRGAKILLSNFPEVIEVMGKIGTSEIPTDPMPMEAMDMMVILKDQDEWTSAKTRDELAEKMSEILYANMPGVSFGFQQPIQMRFNELMTGARQDVVVKVYGEDLTQLADYAARIGRIAQKVEGATDIFVEPIGGLRQVVIRYHRDKLAQFGVDIADVNRAIRMGFSGESAGQVFEQERRFDLVVRLESESRTNLDDVRKLFVTTASGTPVTVDQVAEVTMETGPNQIQRDDAKRRITVGLNIRGRDVASVVNEINQKIEDQIRFKPGYYVNYSGSFKNLEEAKQRLSIAVPIALLLIFILLFFAFRSLRYGLLIFTAIPLSAIGGILALWLRDMPFSISAGVGFIALFGVAVLNGIVLIAEFIRIRMAEPFMDLNDVVLRGTEVRLRPVVMTALVASLGFLPMALSQSSGSEVQRPLATVVIGGLVSATFLTLIVLPVLYTYFEKRTIHE